MTKPFSINPKLDHWVSSEQIKSITAALVTVTVPETMTLTCFGLTLRCRSYLHPEVTNLQPLLEDMSDFIQGNGRRLDADCMPEEGEELIARQPNTTLPTYPTALKPRWGDSLHLIAG